MEVAQIKTKKQLRADVRKALKTENLRAIRMVLFFKNDDDVFMIEDIIESTREVSEERFIYGGFLDDRCIRWAGKYVSVEIVKFN